MKDIACSQAPVISELMRLGFGFLNHLQEPGLLIRYSRAPFVKGTSLRDSEYLIEIIPIPVPLHLWPDQAPVKRVVTKWWKSPPLKQIMRQMLIKGYATMSPDVPQQFRINAQAELIPGSCTELTQVR